ncbi:Hypothetical protein A7982_11615 [Minicystis rosea]|nr:Hypothetical protein A7982_11615 [Minicystis rosea]
MSDFRSIGFYDAATIEAIRLPVWQQLLGAVGYPVGLTANSISYASLRTAFAGATSRVLSLMPSKPSPT